MVLRVGVSLHRLTSHANTGIKIHLLLCPQGSQQNQDLLESLQFVSVDFFFPTSMLKQL